MTVWRTRLAEMRAQSGASAGMYAVANSANSANRSVVSPPAKAIGAIGTNGTGIDLAKRVEPPLRATDGAAWALSGPEIRPAPRVGQIDHDDAECAAMVENYAEAAAEPGATYCFPCGKPVPCGERAWSDACGWCCPTCQSKWSPR